MKLKINIETYIFDVMIYFTLDTIENNKLYSIQLLIILGKFHIHIHKMAWNEANFHAIYSRIETE